MGGLGIFALVGMMSAFFYLFIVAFIFIVIYLLITYLFESMTLFRICKSRGDQVAFLAFVPSYQKYLLGMIAKKKWIGSILMIVDILVIAFFLYSCCTQVLLEWMLLVLLFLLFVSFILNTVIAHYIFKLTNIRYADILTVFSILSFGLLRPIFLFLLRNRSELSN